MEEPKYKRIPEFSHEVTNEDYGRFYDRCIEYYHKVVEHLLSPYGTGLIILYRTRPAVIKSIEFDLPGIVKIAVTNRAAVELYYGMGGKNSEPKFLCFSPDDIKFNEQFNVVTLAFPGEPEIKIGLDLSKEEIELIAVGRTPLIMRFDNNKITLFYKM